MMNDFKRLLHVCYYSWIDPNNAAWVFNNELYIVGEWIIKTKIIDPEIEGTPEFTVTVHGSQDVSQPVPIHLDPNDQGQEVETKVGNVSGFDFLLSELRAILSVTPAVFVCVKIVFSANVCYRHK